MTRFATIGGRAIGAAGSTAGRGTGLAAAVVALGTGELAAAALPGAASPVAATGRQLIDLTPGPLVDIGVGLVEALDKPLLLMSVLNGHAAVGLLAGELDRRRRGAGSALLAAAGIAGGTLAARRPDARAPASAVAGLLGGAAGAAAQAALGPRARPRRALAVAAAGGAAGLAAALVQHRRRATRRACQRSTVLPASLSPPPSPPPGAFDVPGLSPAFTPNADFYVTDVTFPPPAVDPGAWRLRLAGMVEHPLSLGLGDLLDMPLLELDATLVCVHNPVGGDRLGTARWAGVPVRDLLERVRPAAEADQLLACSVDGFSAGVPMGLLRADRPAIVALTMNGEPLPLEHGSPARLLVPGLWGADANTKWLAELRLTTFAEVTDYWDRRGWPREPSPVQPGSRIDVPADRARLAAGPVTIAGVAWSPPRGVRAVEVRVDEGSWREAELSPEIAPTAWRQWRLDWDAPPGPHRLRVRTTGRAARQPEGWAPPYPAGSSGWHEVRVVVAEAGAPLRRAAAEEAAAEGARRLRLAAGAVRAWGGPTPSLPR